MKAEIEDKWDNGGRVKDREVLRKVKALQAGKEYARVPIMNGYKLIEKGKYERRMQDGEV